MPVGGEFDSGGRRLVFVAFLLLWVTNGLALTGLTIFDAALVETLGLTRGELKLRDLLTFALAGIAGPAVGVLVARLGPRRVVLCGLLTLSASLLFYGRVDALWQLYLVHAFIGTGLAAAGLVPVVAAISARFRTARGRALGIALAGTSLGGILFPQLNALLLERFGFRPAFLVLAAIALLMTLGIGALPARPGPGGPGEPSGAPAAGLMSPLRHARLWAVCAIGFATFYSVAAVASHIALYSTDAGHSPTVAGRLLALLFAATLLAKLGAGVLGDRWGSTRMLSAAVLLMAIGSVLIQSAAVAWTGATALLIFGSGWGAVYTLLQATVAQIMPGHLVSRSLGWMVFFDAIGGGLGPWLTGIQFDATGSYSASLLTVGVVLLLAAVLADGLRRTSGAARTDSTPEVKA